MNKKTLYQIPRRTAYDLVVMCSLPSINTLAYVEQALNIEWWRGYHAAKDEDPMTKPTAPTPPSLADIIARLEAAKGPDAALDQEILNYIGQAPLVDESRVEAWAQLILQTQTQWPGTQYAENWKAQDARKAARSILMDCPPFTRSVDAALTLVPKDGEWECGSAKLVADGRWHWAKVITYSDFIGKGLMTPATALCIAALKAVAAAKANGA